MLRVSTEVVMKEIRWVRVQVPEALHARVRQAKARVDATWDRVVEEGVELWLDAVKDEGKKALGTE